MLLRKIFLAMNEFSTKFRVYLEDTDAGGIVYYVNYLKYMERARTEWLRSLGVEFEGLQHFGCQFVVHSVQANYKKPARMDDELIVTAQVEKLGRTYVIFKQRVLKQESVLCEAVVKVACVDVDSLRPRVLPDVLKQPFLAVESAAS